MIEDAQLAYGGVAPKTVLAPKTEAALIGRPLDLATMKAAIAAVGEDIFISPNAPGAPVFLHFRSGPSCYTAGEESHGNIVIEFVIKCYYRPVR